MFYHLWFFQMHCQVAVTIARPSIHSSIHLPLSTAYLDSDVRSRQKCVLAVFPWYAIDNVGGRCGAWIRWRCSSSIGGWVFAALSPKRARLGDGSCLFNRLPPTGRRGSNSSIPGLIRMSARTAQGQRQIGVWCATLCVCSWMAYRTPLWVIGLLKQIYIYIYIIRNNFDSNPPKKYS